MERSSFGSAVDVGLLISFEGQPFQDLSRRIAMLKTLPRLGLLSLIILALLLPGCAKTPEDEAARVDPGEEEGSAERSLDFSFVILGCNRVGWSPDYPTPSTANVPQLKQTLEDIANLPETPRYLFFLGDLVRNEEQDDGSTLKTQLTAWQELYASEDERLGLSTKGLELVPLPGNHEVLASIEYPAGSGSYIEIPNPPSYTVWADWIAGNGHAAHAGNGPTPESDPQDLLVNDNSTISYSFQSPRADGTQVHFVLLDTDTLSTARSEDTACLQDASLADKPLPGWIPFHWAATDIATAEGASDTSLIFAMGHKPIVSPSHSDTSGRDNILNCTEYPLADDLLGTFQTHGKVVAYLASHDHLWDYREIGGDTGRSIPQVVAGDAGSPLSGGDVFGFTLVEVFSDGGVEATSYGRPVPDPYDSPEGVEPATPRQTVVLRSRAHPPG
jgi:hypothetical protein